MESTKREYKGTWSEYLGRRVFYFPPWSDFGTVIEPMSSELPCVDGCVLVKFEDGSVGWCHPDSLVLIDKQDRKTLKTLLERLGGR